MPNDPEYIHSLRQHIVANGFTHAHRPHSRGGTIFLYRPSVAFPDQGMYGQQVLIHTKEGWYIGDPIHVMAEGQLAKGAKPIPRYWRTVTLVTSTELRKMKASDFIEGDLVRIEDRYTIHIYYGKFRLPLESFVSTADSKVLNCTPGVRGGWPYYIDNFLSR